MKCPSQWNGTPVPFSRSCSVLDRKGLITKRVGDCECDRRSSAKRGKRTTDKTNGLNLRSVKSRIIASKRANRAPRYDVRRTIDASLNTGNSGVMQWEITFYLKVSGGELIRSSRMRIHVCINGRWFKCRVSVSLRLFLLLIDNSFMRGKLCDHIVR